MRTNKNGFSKLIFIRICCFFLVFLFMNSCRFCRSVSAEEKRHKIGVFGYTENKSDPLYKLYHNLQYAESVLPIEIVSGKAHSSEVENVKYLISQDVDGLILYIADENMLPTVCGLCEEAKVFWGIYLWQIQNEDIRSLCESSEYYIGNTFEQEEIIGYDMIKKAHELGYRKIALISEEKWNVTCAQREKGILDAMQELNGIEIVTTVRSIREKKDAMGITDKLVTAYPDLDCILIAGTKGTEIPEGIIAQIQECGKEDQIRLMSIDLPVDLQECFSSGILTVAYGLPSLSLDPVFLFYDLLNYVEGTPLSEEPTSYYLNGLMVDNKERAEELADFLDNPDQLFFDPGQISALRRKETPSLDEKEFQKFIIEYIEAL